MSEEAILGIRSLFLANEDREVLRGVSLDVLRGEVHAVVGDHNSGKTLLAEIISGGIRFNRGQLVFDGLSVRRHSPTRAFQLGIGAIHQFPQLVSSFTVFDNIFLHGVLNRSFSPAERKTLSDLARSKLNAFSLDVALDTVLERCSSTDVLIVSIVKSLCSSFRLLVVDEVSNKLSASQAECLLNELSLLSHKGASILYFTSNVEEIYQFADRVSFLQEGRIIATEVATKLDKLDLVQLSYSHLYSRKELEKSNYELFYLKNYYENIINTMPVPLLLISTQGKILYANTMFAERYGLSKDEIEGKAIHQVLSSSSGHDDFSGPQSPSDFDLRHLENLHLIVGRSRAPQSLYKMPIYDDEKAFLGSLLYFDASAGGELIEERNRRMQALNRVPFFAHEIRNPLGILSNFLLLIKEKSESGDIKEYLLRSEGEIKRINNIIKSLMEEEKASSEAARGRFVNIWSSVEEVRELFLPMLNEKKIRMNNDIFKDVFVRCDEDELKEVLINLIKNAIEATDKYGTIYVTCAADTEGEKPSLSVSVTDTGQGIALDDMEKIFEPFYSTKPGDEKRGLGLAICRDIVSAWGGTMKAESPPYRGATFTIILPHDRFELRHSH